MSGPATAPPGRECANLERLFAGALEEIDRLNRIIARAAEALDCPGRDTKPAARRILEEAGPIDLEAEART